MAATKTRYAKAGDVDIAYQVVGEGPVDLLLYTGWMIPIDCMDDEPSMARFQRRMGSFCRILRFDARGVGLSDRRSAAEPPTHEQWVEDALAVLDAVGSEQATVFAPWGHAGTGIMLAASHPDRVTGLIIVSGAARVMWAPDYPDGFPADFGDNTIRLSNEPDSVEKGYDVLGQLSPTMAEDAAFRAWWDRAGNLGATPAMAQVMWDEILTTDVRHLLPLIEVPTLVVQPAHNPTYGLANGRYLAEHIPGATSVELARTDVLYWVGDTGPLLDEIEEFVTGVRGRSGAERILATVLFTDIVGSTDRAAQMGDDRWRDLLDRHDQSVRIQIDRFRGRVVKTVGDGFVATFDSPGRAIECAAAIRDTVTALSLSVRAGIHTGEIEQRGDDVAGLSVHIGARISALAGPGEILVSSTVKDLVAGSPARFVDRGEHELKGVPGTWRLFAADG